jgi:hypothetical protein
VIQWEELHLIAIGQFISSVVVDATQFLQNSRLRQLLACGDAIARIAGETYMINFVNIGF